MEGSDCVLSGSLTDHEQHRGGSGGLQGMGYEVLTLVEQRECIYDALFLKQGDGDTVSSFFFDHMFLLLETSDGLPYYTGKMLSFQHIIQDYANSIFFALFMYYFIFWVLAIPVFC